MKLSIVSTLYCSEKYIHEFYKRCSDTAIKLVSDDYEIIFVNDGSPDGSLNEAVTISESDEHISVIDLSRNFGHHKAMMTGLSRACGDHIFLIDSDLEEKPEWLLRFWNEMHLQKSDVVYGVQKSRKGGYIERLSGAFFYKLLRFFTKLEMPENIVTARLMTKRYVSALLYHKEREIMIAGLWLITGYKQVPKEVTKLHNSKTTYSVKNKLSILVNSVTSFSNVPLKGIFYTGTSIFGIATSYILYLVLNRIFISTPVDGWTSVMASIWLLGGMIISFIGIIGIYLSKIFSETKQRPYTIIREIYGSKSNKQYNK